MLAKARQRQKQFKPDVLLRTVYSSMIQFDTYFIMTAASICAADCEQQQGQDFHEKHQALCVFHHSLCVHCHFLWIYHRQQQQ